MGKAKLRAVEVEGAAAEVQSLLAEMVGKHGMSVDAVLVGCRIAAGRVDRLRRASGFDLAEVQPAGSA